MASIFISHTKKDKAFVRDLANRLRRHRIKVWVDEAEIKVGDSLIKKIEQGINDTEFLAVVLSPNSIASSWVNKELEIAMTKEIQGKTIKVLPLLYKKCNIPLFLQGKLFADFTSKKRFDLAVDKILDVLDVEPFKENNFDGTHCIKLRTLIEKISVHFSPNKTEVAIYGDWSGIDFIKVEAGNDLFSFYSIFTRPSLLEILSKVFERKVADITFGGGEIVYDEDEKKANLDKIEELRDKYDLPKVVHPGEWYNKSEIGKLAYDEYNKWCEGSRVVSIEFA